MQRVKGKTIKIIDLLVDVNWCNFLFRAFDEFCKHTIF